MVWDPGSTSAEVFAGEFQGSCDRYYSGISNGFERDERTRDRGKKDPEKVAKSYIVAHARNPLTFTKTEG